MYRAPVVVGERNYSRTFQARQHAYDFLHTVFGSVHAYVFLVFRVSYRLKSEKHFAQDFFLLVAHLLVTYEHSLAPRNNLHLAEVIAHQCGTAAYYVENTDRKSVV